MKRRELERELAKAGVDGRRLKPIAAAGLCRPQGCRPDRCTRGVQSSLEDRRGVSANERGEKCAPHPALPRSAKARGDGVSATTTAATRWREAWRRIMAAMDADEVHDFLTPDEEMRWLRALACHLLETTKSVRPLTRDEILDRLSIVLAESRGAPLTRKSKRRIRRPRARSA